MKDIDIVVEHSSSSDRSLDSANHELRLPEEEKGDPTELIEDAQEPFGMSSRKSVDSLTIS